MQLLVRDIRKDNGPHLVQRDLGLNACNRAKVVGFIFAGIYMVVCQMVVCQMVVCKNLPDMLLSADLIGSVWRVGI